MCVCHTLAVVTAHIACYGRTDSPFPAPLFPSGSAALLPSTLGPFVKASFGLLGDGKILSLSFPSRSASGDESGLFDDSGDESGNAPSPKILSPGRLTDRCCDG